LQPVILLAKQHALSMDNVALFLHLDHTKMPCLISMMPLSLGTPLEEVLGLLVYVRSLCPQIHLFKTRSERVDHTRLLPVHLDFLDNAPILFLAIQVVILNHLIQPLSSQLPNRVRPLELGIRISRKWRIALNEY
jgi:hypothetical protein